MKKYLLFIPVFLFLFSCNETFRDFQKVEDMKWHRNDVKKFKVNIPEDGSYDLFFAMRHSTGYPFTSIKILINQLTPDGNELTKEAEFQVANDAGEYIGEVTGQLWDIKALFSENTTLKKGEYVFEIMHNMNTDPVILVIDIGLIIKKSK